MKAHLQLPDVGVCRPTVAGPAAAAIVMCVAMSSRFLHPINPVPPSAFPACMYIALAALAAFRVPMAAPLRIAVWAPAWSHLALITFAAYSFLTEGHWPWYSSPDPKDLHAAFLYFVAMLSVLIGFLSMPAAGLALLGTLCEPRRSAAEEKAIQLVYGVAISALGGWLWIFEWRDGRLIEWLLD